jgi:hypothetical protein
VTICCGKVLLVRALYPVVKAARVPSTHKYTHMYTFIILICTLGNPCFMVSDATPTLYHTPEACVMAGTLKRDELMSGLTQLGYTMDRSDVECILAPPSA